MTPLAAPSAEWLAPDPDNIETDGNRRATRVPARSTNYVERLVDVDIPRMTGPSIPITQRAPSGLEVPDRAKIARYRVRPRYGMQGQNISQAGRVRRPLTNRATIGPRQYPFPALGSARVVARESPEEFAPWWIGQK